MSRHCSRQESIATNSRAGRGGPRVSHCPVPFSPPSFPSFRNVRTNVVIEDFGKDVFRYLIGGAHDIESLYTCLKDLPAISLTSCWMTSGQLSVFSCRSLSFQGRALTLIQHLRLTFHHARAEGGGRLLKDVEP